jgi:hypothetical protein
MRLPDVSGEGFHHVGVISINIVLGARNVHVGGGDFLSLGGDHAPTRNKVEQNSFG